MNGVKLIIVVVMLMALVAAGIVATATMDEKHASYQKAVKHIEYMP